MQVIKKEGYYLLKNDKGEYHLDHSKFDELGEQAALKLATKEIEKKAKLKYYQEVDIDLARARELGFCEYGIKDFCEQLELDVSKTYKINHLLEKLTVGVFTEYSSECLKLFGTLVFDKFGGARNLLSENKTQNVMNLVIEHVLSETDCHLLACEFAKKSLENFEKEFPEDKRPRLAIEAKEKFVKGEITEEELSAAWSAARSAESAARSAGSAESAEIEWQINKVLERL